MVLPGIAIVIFVTWVGLALAVLADGEDLLGTFRKTYPTESYEVGLLEAGRNSKKMWYFLGARAEHFLAKQADQSLQSLRRRFARRFWTFVIFHFGVMASIGLVGLTLGLLS